jgi:hypothetical protein
VILSQQNITGMDHECLAAYGHEFECAGQGNDVFRDRSVVPVIGGLGWRFLEVDRFRIW